MHLNKIIPRISAVFLITSTAAKSFTISDYNGLFWLIELFSSIILGAYVTIFFSKKRINLYFVATIYLLIGLFLSPHYILHTFFWIEIPSYLFKINTLGFETFFKFLTLEIISLSSRVGLTIIVIYSIYATILLKNILLKNK